MCVFLVFWSSCFSVLGCAWCVCFLCVSFVGMFLFFLYKIVGVVCLRVCELFVRVLFFNCCTCCRHVFSFVWCFLFVVLVCLWSVVVVLIVLVLCNVCWRFSNIGWSCLQELLEVSRYSLECFKCGWSCLISWSLCINMFPRFVNDWCECPQTYTKPQKIISQKTPHNMTKNADTLPKTLKT